MDKKREKLLLVNNQLNELARIEVFLEELGNVWDLPDPLIMSLNLALEEAFTNIVSYGYSDTNGHIIEINFEKHGDILRISVTDDGHEFDPTVGVLPDTNLSAEERPVGGLGILMIRKMMDKVEYERINGKNHLILTKNI